MRGATEGTHKVPWAPPSSPLAGQTCWLPERGCRWDQGGSRLPNLEFSIQKEGPFCVNTTMCVFKGLVYTPAETCKWAL